MRDLVYLYKTFTNVLLGFVYQDFMVAPISGSRFKRSLVRIPKKSWYHKDRFRVTSGSEGTTYHQNLPHKSYKWGL